MRLHSILATAFLPASLLVATASAQGGLTLSDLPKCATQCLLQSLNSTKCSPLDMPCICGDERFQDVVTVCVLHDCTVKEGLRAKNITATTCDAPVRDRSHLLANIYIGLGVTGVAMVALRLAFKPLVLRLGWGLDDWFIFSTGVVVSTSTAVGVRGGIAHGLGKDIWTLSPDTIGTFARYFYVMELLYLLELTLLKMSLLFFYLRIFPATATRRLLWITIGFNAVYGAGFVFLAAFQCRPVSVAWTGWDGEHPGTCLSTNPLAWAHAAISIALDVWMLAIPLSQLRTLKLHWKKKVGVGLMFFVGTFVTIVSILRLQSLVHFANSTNPTWDNWDTTNWSTIEINVGIICATLPTARLMLKRVFPSLGGTTRNTKGYYLENDTGSKWPPGQSTSRSADVAGGPGGESITRKHNAIIHEQTFTVQYAQKADGPFGDQDEQHLVRMRDLDRGGNEIGSERETRSDISARSDVSL